jgi:hypothetical protein
MFFDSFVCVDVVVEMKKTIDNARIPRLIRFCFSKAVYQSCDIKYSYRRKKEESEVEATSLGRSFIIPHNCVIQPLFKHKKGPDT